MHENLFEMLDQISDRHLEEAAGWKLRRQRIWVRAVAAVLAVVMLLVLFQPEPTAVQAQELVSPAGVSLPERPQEEDYPDWERYREALEEYRESERNRSRAANQAMTTMADFWKDSFQVFLEGDENGVWSPVNAYLSLAMVAQAASGETRQEILDALGVDSIDALQEDVQAIFQQVWRDEVHSKRLLANSLWLDADFTYRQENLDILGERYYASVYRTELDDPAAEEDIQTWMMENTDGFLTEIPPSRASGWDVRALTLVSTLFVDENWLETFDPETSRPGTFHAPVGDVDCTYMNALMDGNPYARLDNCTVSALPTEAGCYFWVILPDAGTSVSDLLDSGDYLSAILGQDLERRKVRLTMPKFDISDSMDLSDGLKKLGIRRAFSPLRGDFSGTLDGEWPIFVSEIRQSSRIQVDETGIWAASGTVVDLISAGLDEPVTMVLDRPFLFLLTVGDIPLFAGVVAEP